MVRAALISLALLAHGIYALPLPRPISQSDLKKEWRQNDIEMWRGWLDSVGIAVSHEQLEDLLMWSTNTFGELHKTLKKPFEPIFEATSTNQAWALFASATTAPDRLVVQVQREGSDAWETLYRRNSTDRVWNDHRFRYRRIRAVYDSVRDDRPRAPYKNFTRWVAREAFHDDPTVERARVHLERTYSTYPWEEDDPEVEIKHQRPHKRENHVP